MTVSGRLVVASLALATVQAQGKAYIFNPNLVGGGSEADLSFFNQGSQLPGQI